jgi:heptosyltransferase III
MAEIKKIIISRTDSIGDVMLTLPLCGFLKTKYPSIEIFFIGKAYTKALIDACENIDHFIDRDEIIKNEERLRSLAAEIIIFAYPDKEVAKAAKRAKIKLRIGTSHRLYHWLYCNKLVHFTRKKSELHEALLNFKLLTPLGIKVEKTEKEIPPLYGFNKISKSNSEYNKLIQPAKMNLIFHPKSKGSAREWPVENYFALAKILPDANILITGTKQEGDLIRSQKSDFFEQNNIHDLTGKLSLDELISFINECDGLVACSTGPLHIAAALGKPVCGIYPPMKPIHPGRWAPLGKNATVLVLEKPCDDCKKNQNCHCIKSIEVNQVLNVVEIWKKEKT